MKTAEKLVATLQISDLQLTVEIVNLIREYGAQVREEAARGLEVIGDQHAGNDVCDDFVRILLPKLGAAIRKMELP